MRFVPAQALPLLNRGVFKGQEPNVPILDLQTQGLHMGDFKGRLFRGTHLGDDGHNVPLHLCFHQVPSEIPSSQAGKFGGG